MTGIFRRPDSQMPIAHRAQNQNGSLLKVKRANARFAKFRIFKEDARGDFCCQKAKAGIAEMRALLLLAEFWGDIGHCRRQGELLFEAAQKAGEAANEYRKASELKKCVHCLAVSDSLFWQAIRALDGEKTPCRRLPPDNCKLQAECFARLNRASDAFAKTEEYLRLSSALSNDQSYALGCEVLERKRAIMEGFFSFEKNMSNGITNMRPMIEAAQKMGDAEGDDAVHWMKVMIGLAANTNRREPAPV